MFYDENYLNWYQLHLNNDKLDSFLNTEVDEQALGLLLIYLNI